MTTHDLITWLSGLGLGVVLAAYLRPGAGRARRSNAYRIDGIYLALRFLNPYREDKK